MRVRFALVLVVFSLSVLASRAQADSRIQTLITGYEKEAASCQIHSDGVTKVQFGAVVLQKDALEHNAPDASLDADVDQLAKASVSVQTYCDEVKG